MNSPQAPAATFDLNADLSEGYGRWSFGTDDDLLTVVTSANIACGFHAGDPGIIRRALAVAAENGVTVGAHVGYPDLQGFGRRVMEMDNDELRDAVLYQMAALDGLAQIEGLAVSYVKPHGALYNRAAVDNKQAAAIIEAVRTFDPSLVVLGLPGSALLRHAEAAGIPTRREAFADRAYEKTGTLVPRNVAGAVLHDVDEISRRALAMVLDGAVEAIDGATVAVPADSLCVHGDTANAVQIARAIRAALEQAGLVAQACVPSRTADKSAVSP